MHFSRWQISRLLRPGRDSRQAAFDERRANHPKAHRSPCRRRLGDPRLVSRRHANWLLPMGTGRAREACGRSRCWDNPPRSFARAQWGLQVSPDGTHIAFAPATQPSGHIREIWLIGSQGDNPQKVLALGENDGCSGRCTGHPTDGAWATLGYSVLRRDTSYRNLQLEGGESNSGSARFRPAVVRSLLASRRADRLFAAGVCVLD